MKLYKLLFSVLTLTAIPLLSAISPEYHFLAQIDAKEQLRITTITVDTGEIITTEYNSSYGFHQEISSLAVVTEVVSSESNLSVGDTITIVYNYQFHFEIAKENADTLINYGSGSPNILTVDENSPAYMELRSNSESYMPVVYEYSFENVQELSPSNFSLNDDDSFDNIGKGELYLKWLRPGFFELQNGQKITNYVILINGHQLFESTDLQLKLTYPEIHQAFIDNGIESPFQGDTLSIDPVAYDRDTLHFQMITQFGGEDSDAIYSHPTDTILHLVDPIDNPVGINSTSSKVYKSPRSILVNGNRLSINSLHPVSNVKIFSVTGKLLHQTAQYHATISLNPFAKGTYVVQWSSRDALFSHKITIK